LTAHTSVRQTSNPGEADRLALWLALICGSTPPQQLAQEIAHTRHPVGSGIVATRRGCSKSTLLNGVSHRLELEDHRYRGTGVMCMDHKHGRLKVNAWFLTEPANDGHAAIIAVMINVVLTAQIMIEMNLIPWLVKRLDAVNGGLDPDGIGIDAQKFNGPFRVVVQKQHAAVSRQIRLESKDQQALKGMGGAEERCPSVQDLTSSGSRAADRRVGHLRRRSVPRSSPQTRPIERRASKLRRRPLRGQPIVKQVDLL
jgi:hypothetical protein